VGWLEGYGRGYSNRGAEAIHAPPVGVPLELGERRGVNPPRRTERFSLPRFLKFF